MLIHKVIGCVVVLLFAMTWWNQKSVIWYSNVLPSGERLTLGITNVYIDGHYVGILDANCTLGLATAILPSDRCSHFHNVQKMALLTLALSFCGMTMFFSYELGCIKRRYPATKFLLLLLIISGIASIDRSFLILPAEYFIAWIISMIFTYRSYLISSSKRSLDEEEVPLIREPPNYVV